MTPDDQTNKIYFSEWLKEDFPNLYKEIEEKLQKHHQQYELLNHTEDYWARDFMPIQVAKSKFVQYKYNPDYLKKEKRFITNVNKVCRSLEIQTIKTDIVLDGGNIVKHNTCAILTDKIFLENKAFSKEELIAKLKTLFDVEKICIIPWDENEPFGHTDGMLRFIDESTVLINGYFKDYEESFKDNFFNALKKSRLEYKELDFQYRKETDNYTWAYINFLQTKDLILLPNFGIKEDEQALEQIKEYFPTYNIEQINVKEFVEKGGGALNCISWTREI